MRNFIVSHGIRTRIQPDHSQTPNPNYVKNAKLNGQAKKSNTSGFSTKSLSLIGSTCNLEEFADFYLTLGISVDEASEVDEAELRKVFRQRVRRLHPDAQTGVRVARGGSDGVDPTRGEGEGDEGEDAVPTIYAINQAYETVKRVL